MFCTGALVGSLIINIFDAIPPGQSCPPHNTGKIAPQIILAWIKSTRKMANKLGFPQSTIASV